MELISIGTDKGVFLSTNNGNNWTDINNGETYYVSCLAINGSNIYTGRGFDGVYVSSNNGTSWKIINEGLPQYSSGNCINTIAINGENIFIGTGSNWNGGVYMLPKNSSSWILKGLTYYGSINATTVNGTNIFIGTGGDYEEEAYSFHQTTKQPGLM